MVVIAMLDAMRENVGNVVPRPCLFPRWIVLHLGWIGQRLGIAPRIRFVL